MVSIRMLTFILLTFLLEYALLDVFIYPWMLSSLRIYVFCFEDEPGKQVRSAIRIKNTSKSHVAFKVWTKS